MPHLHHSNSFRAIALLSMVTMLLPACTSWQPISLQSGAVPYQVRITTESERFGLKAGHLFGDTVITGLQMVRYDITHVRSVRVIDIQLLERKKISRNRTVLLVLGITLGFLAVWASTYELDYGFGDWDAR